MYTTFGLACCTGFELSDGTRIIIICNFPYYVLALYCSVEVSFPRLLYVLSLLPTGHGWEEC